MERAQETKIVKDALKAAGINSKASHGHGTAWGWLHINIGSSEQYPNHDRQNPQHEYRDCIICQNHNKLSEVALRISQNVTGRHGEYGGNINVYTQKDWNVKKQCSEEIFQSPNVFDILKLKEVA